MRFFMLNEARKGQIAVAMMKEILRDKEIHTLKPNSIRRQVANFAKEMNMPENEVFEFIQIITAEVISEAFGKKIHWES